MRFAAMILAAGASTRFGGAPKSLLRVGDESAVHRLARLALQANFDPVIVVVGIHESEIAQDVCDLSVQFVVNTDWRLGRTRSVQKGIEVLGDTATILLWPVDHPFVEAKTLQLLREANMQHSTGLWFIPTYEGRGGHPVLLKPEVLSRIQALPADAPLRSMLRSLGSGVIRLAVPDPGVVANIDTPQEYDRYVKEWEARKVK